LALGELPVDGPFVFSLSRSSQHCQGASHPCGGGPGPDRVIQQGCVVAGMASNKFVGGCICAATPEMSSARPAQNSTVHVFLWGKEDF